MTAQAGPVLRTVSPGQQVLLANKDKVECLESLTFVLYALIPVATEVFTEKKAIMSAEVLVSESLVEFSPS
jgi:hypothetical protein